MKEHRIRLLLVFVLLAQLVLLTAQLPGSGGRGSYLETITLRLLAPFARLVAATGETMANWRRGLKSRARLRAENARLLAEVRELRRERVRFQGLDLEVERLSRGLQYVRPQSGSVRVADVVYIDHVSWMRTLILYVADSPVMLDDPVVVHNGLVGRVVLRSGRYAKVQLVTDRASSVGAMIARTRRQGIVRGAGDGALALDYVALQADVRVGDRVVTAGIDGVFPRGIPIGTVSAVEPGSELFYKVRLAPAVDFGMLDQVFVLAGQASQVADPEVRRASP